MKMAEQFRVFEWIKQNVQNGQETSYATLAREASAALGLDIKGIGMKKLLSAADIQITPTRGSGGPSPLKQEVARLTALVEDYDAVLGQVLETGKVPQSVISAVVEDTSWPAEIRQLFADEIG